MDCREQRKVLADSPAVGVDRRGQERLRGQMTQGMDMHATLAPESGDLRSESRLARVSKSRPDL